MTIHDLQSLAFPPTDKATLAALRGAGGDKTRRVVPAQGQDEKNAPAGRNPDTQRIPQPSGAVHFFVPGKPQGKGRPRASRAGRHIRLYTPEKTASYESMVALAASQAMVDRALIDGPVSVTVRMRHPVPKSWSKKKQAAALDGCVLPTVKCDADNCVKAIFDAINGVVWVDDVQVVDLTLTKRYAAVPGVHVSVAVVEGGE
jgi:Holliday junction resolvase RusA-like endonuclease